MSDPTIAMQEHLDAVRAQLRKLDGARERVRSATPSEFREALEAVKREAAKLATAAEEAHAAAKAAVRRAAATGGESGA